MSNKSEEYWKRAMSANNQRSRSYWLNRYEHECEEKKYKNRRPKIIRKIDDILGDNNGSKTS